MKRYNRYSLLERHYDFLHRLDFKCQFSGKTVGKEVRGNYQKYHFHHTHSGAYGYERVGYNYILLSWWSHWFVHFLGGVFLPGKSVTKQNKRARSLPLTWLWKFPNPLQRLFHFWCRLPNSPMRSITLSVSLVVLYLMLRELFLLIYLTP